MGCGCGSDGSGSSCGSNCDSGCGHSEACSSGYKMAVFDWLSNVEQPASAKCNFVEVRFKNDRKHFFLNSDKLPVRVGSVVVVEASSGYDVGGVTLTGELVKIQMKKKRAEEDQALKIYRVATKRDIELWQDSRKKENAVKIEARKIAKALNLQMKISDVEYQGDGTKITFYYTAEKRVDFRQLIKDYAVAFRTKIDMKQIGFRQEAAKIGGISSSGRELCCSTWLTDFRSVNTQAARYQQLSINPQKLAGQCGKLKCCLNFELDSYLDALKDFPSSSSILQTEKGRAFCIKIDVFKKKMWFAYEGNSVTWYDLEVDQVKSILERNKQGLKIESLEKLQESKNKSKEDYKMPAEEFLPLVKEPGGRNRKSRNQGQRNRSKTRQSSDQERRKDPKDQRGRNQNNRRNSHHEDKPSKS